MRIHTYTHLDINTKIETCNYREDLYTDLKLVSESGAQLHLFIPANEEGKKIIDNLIQQLMYAREFHWPFERSLEDLS